MSPCPTRGGPKPEILLKGKNKTCLPTNHWCSTNVLVFLAGRESNLGLRRKLQKGLNDISCSFFFYLWRWKFLIKTTNLQFIPKRREGLYLRPKSSHPFPKIKPSLPGTLFIVVGLLSLEGCLIAGIKCGNGLVSLVKSQPKPAFSHPMDMEIFAAKKTWSFVGFIPRFMQKQSFHALTSNIHPCGGYTSPKCLKTTINRYHKIWELPQTTPKTVVARFPIYTFHTTMGVTWGFSFGSPWGIPSTIAPPCWDHPPCVPLHQTGRRNEVVGTFISCSSLRRAVKSERKAAVLNPFHRWLEVCRRQTYSTKIIRGNCLDFTSCGWKDKLFFFQ